MNNVRRSAYGLQIAGFGNVVKHSWSDGGSLLAFARSQESLVPLLGLASQPTVDRISDLVALLLGGLREHRGLARGLATRIMHAVQRPEKQQRCIEQIQWFSGPAPLLFAHAASRSR